MDKDKKTLIIAGEYKGDKICEFGITHYYYDDCEEKSLVKTEDGILVRRECFEGFERMRADGLKSGIDLNIISGFRSSKYQIEVFSRKFEDINNVSDEQFEARLKYSAPAGFSEHHTGLAVDINSLEEDFEETKEFEWLNNNAVKYGFEMSFPKNNIQGLGYEPWHWRYIGKNGEFKTVFAAVRNKDPRFC